MDNDPSEEPPPVEQEPTSSPSPTPQSPQNPLGGLGKFASSFSPLPPTPQTGLGELPESDEKLWSMFSHIGGIIGLGFIAPLVVYLIQKDRSPYIAAQSREALNFQLSYLIYFAVCAITSFLVLPAFIMMAIGILMIVLGIIAGIKAYEGTFVPLPFTIRFLK